jgi:hypothetical protein
MPFLLLLSALLTALTGAVTGVRPNAVQIARLARPAEAVRAVAAAPLAAGHRHLIGDFDLRAAFAPARIAVALVAAPRLYLDRLRA